MLPRPSELLLSGVLEERPAFLASDGVVYSLTVVCQVVNHALILRSKSQDRFRAFLCGPISETCDTSLQQSAVLIYLSSNLLKLAACVAG